MLHVCLQKKKLKEKGRKIVMDAKAAMKKGLNAIKDFRLGYFPIVYVTEAHPKHWIRHSGKHGKNIFKFFLFYF